MGTVVANPFWTYLLGPFVGASLAFFLARFYDSSRRYKEQVVAANLALLTIKTQYNDFLLFRRGFLNEVARNHTNDDTPFWALVRPTFTDYGKYEFDFQSTGFLFEELASAKVFDEVQIVQELYRSLVKLEEFRTEVARKSQEEIASYHRDHPRATLAEIEKLLGPSTIAALEMIAVGLAIRAVDNGSYYLEAFDGLRATVTSRLERSWHYRFERFFCSGSDSDFTKLIKIQTEGRFELSKLPALPSKLAAEVNAIIQKQKEERERDREACATVKAA
jgi:hypothetical protein